MDVGQPPDAAFARYVNLGARELERWLDTDTSRAAVADGNTAGPTILRLLRTPKDDRSSDDINAIHDVVSHIVAERERRPDGDVIDSAWRHGLMNWGHDPMTWSPAPPPAAAVASAGRTAPAPRAGDPVDRSRSA